MDGSYGCDYAMLYHHHWWWRTRERILTRVIRSLCLRQPAEILDVGCGNGLFLSRLREFGRVRGIEIDTSLLSDDGPYRDRIYTEPLSSPCYRGWQCDLITACDVIEHIERDEDAMEQMLAMLKPGGYLVLTVPAFQLLWDQHDEMNHHYRRYNRKEIENLLSSKTEKLFCRYMFHSIFAPKLAVKLWNLRRGEHEKLVQHRLPSRLVNRVMQSFCYAEYRLTQSLALPFGTSILAIAQKSDQIQPVARPQS